MLKNSARTRMFRHSYAQVNGKRTDILENGSLSCAFFVSTVLAMFRLIDRMHSTVDGAVKDLEESGWKKIRRPMVGSVLVWESKTDEDGPHRHMGFYIGKDQAVSNSTQRGYPVIHHWTYGKKRGLPRRKVESIYWYTEDFDKISKK
ncbi:MAG: hypothetical protein AAB581_03200 [Patescibacteria group bacterium]